MSTVTSASSAQHETARVFRMKTREHLCPFVSLTENLIMMAMGIWMPLKQLVL
ncbi:MULTISPECIES: hypothetical protein [unclassified Halomonas]|uniref:hypothetical protein n=1 Tax=unclassified Halomonas TaxID=2609666 RepID=UPI00246961E2|nr:MULTISPECIES: hypothetical protein [unclassified Halomonas]